MSARATKRTRIGFVGAGFMGQLAHLSRYATIPGCGAVALVEPRTETAKLVARRYGVPHVYSTIEEMLPRDAATSNRSDSARPPFTSLARAPSPP
jgi:predicted dehydrogenase